MGIAKRLKAVMVLKGLAVNKVATDLGKAPQTFYNMLQRDVMKYSEVEKIADKIGCDIILRDRETGREF